MNLPLTISYTGRVINQDGTVSLTAVLKDGGGVTLSTTPNSFGAEEPASSVIAWLRSIVNGYLQANLMASDIPVNVSISYGLPAAVRPIDLIL